MSTYNFKRITTVPTGKEFMDIILSKTQRKTPTVVHPQYDIGRIRQFYMRKVKFAQQSFHDRLSQVIDDFPKLDDIHPFYADLMNILYDRDHYKLALGQINVARHLIDNVAKDYVKLLKFGDSLYRCKQLKRAALGRMCTIIKKHTASLAYLEQVRQHLARLPSIDPNTRTLLICGYPNVGKSSFINKLTRADVDVQPYAFTTKSLFVGHMDYKFLRWQVIDTPGILDHPLEERNTIEMQSITALAHLRACILYFMDLSEQCGYTIEQQVKLFHSIKPLFANKPILLVINKIDLRRLDQLTPEEKSLVDSVTQHGVTCVQSSCATDEGVMNVKSAACELLLTSRVDVKLRGKNATNILNRLHLAMPEPRDNKERKPHIPEGAQKAPLYDKTDPNRRKLARDLEVEAGGAGVFTFDHRKQYLLNKDEWKYDAVPEILNGKNVMDFVDPEIEEKLDALEREEEQLESTGFYNILKENRSVLDEEGQLLKEAVKEIQNRKKLIVQQHRINKARNRGAVPAVRKSRKAYDSNDENEENASDHEGSGDDMMDIDQERRGRSRTRQLSKSRTNRSLSSVSHSVKRDRSVLGFRDESTRRQEFKKKDHERAKMGQREAKRGEADRRILNEKPKHLFSGKRKVGKNDRR